MPFKKELNLSTTNGVRAHGSAALVFLFNR